MDQERLTRLASLPKKAFDVFVAELESYGVVDVCESQSHADIVSRAHSHCSDLVVYQLLSWIDCFVRNDGVEDVYVEFDKLDPVESMRVLKDLFELLRNELVKQTSDNLSAVDVRRIVQDYLKKLMPNARAHHIAKLENTHTVEKILNNLVQDGFCSHLDCKILIAAIKELPQDTEDVEGTERDDQDTTELVQMLQSYQDKYESFCKEIALGVLRDTLASNSDLKPNKSVGTPYLVFRLSYPWVNLRYHTALSVLTSILPLVSDLQLQAIEGTSDTILLVFCGFEAPLISLFNDHLQNPEVMEALRELKIVPKVESAEQPILAELHLPCTDVSPEAPGTDHTDQDDEQRKQKQVLHENVDLQDTSETTLLLELKEMMSSIRKTNYEIEEEKYSFKKETEDIRTKYDAEMMTMHEELEKFINEAAGHREEIASLKQALNASRTQEARQENEALQNQVNSLHELLKQELERLHEDGIKAKEEAEGMHEQLVNENSFLRERLAQLNQHVEELTKQHAESSSRNDELKQELLKTVIEQISGGYSKLADQLKEMRETNTRELQEKDSEITRLEVLPRVPHEEDHSIRGSTTTLSPNVTPNPSPIISPECSLHSGVYVVVQIDDTAGQNVTHSSCVTNNT